MRIADALVSVLADLGVKYVFGVSGANIEHLHDAIHRAGAGRLRSVLARREDGAACMADARARVHRTLGVCCATSGGGMMNLLAGLAESYTESVPVLALVGQPPAALDGRGSFQDSSGIGRTVDALALLSTVTKKAVRISRGGRISGRCCEMPSKRRSPAGRGRWPCCFPGTATSSKRGPGQPAGRGI